MIERSVPQLEGQVSFARGSWDSPLKTSLVTMWELMKPSWCPNRNAIELRGNDDESLHDLAMIHYLLALKKKTRQEDKQPTELSKRLDEGGYLPGFQLWNGKACIWEPSLLENVERTASPASQFVLKTEHVG